MIFHIFICSHNIPCWFIKSRLLRKYNTLKNWKKSIYLFVGLSWTLNGRGRFSGNESGRIQSRTTENYTFLRYVILLWQVRVVTLYTGKICLIIALFNLSGRLFICNPELSGQYMQTSPNIGHVSFGKSVHRLTILSWVCQGRKLSTQI